jgi:hypothetical protein
MEKDIIQNIVDQYLTGDKDLAIAQVNELKLEGDFFNRIVPFFNPKTDSLFISTLEDSIKLFLVSPECKSVISENQNCFQIESAIGNIFRPLKEASLSLSTKDLSYNEDSIGKEIYLIRSLFGKQIIVGVTKDELQMLADASIDSIEAQISASNDCFEVVEKREFKSSLESSFESFKQTLMIFAMKNITPKTVAVGAIAVSVAMQMLGAPQSHADVTHAHNLIDSDVMDNVLQKISDNISQLDHSHSNIVKVLENHVQGAHNGSGSFKIQVGDCFVQGDYGMVKTASFENQHVNVSSGFFTHGGTTTEAPAVCKDWAQMLEKVLREKISQSLER